MRQRVRARTDNRHSRPLCLPLGRLAKGPPLKHSLIFITFRVRISPAISFVSNLNAPLAFPQVAAHGLGFSLNRSPMPERHLLRAHARRRDACTPRLHPPVAGIYRSRDPAKNRRLRFLQAGQRIPANVRRTHTTPASLRASFRWRRCHEARYRGRERSTHRRRELVGD